MIHYLIVFLISMVPLIELRLAIPYAVGLGLNMPLSYVLAIIGNMIPVPLIFFFARKILVWGAGLKWPKGLGGRKGRSEAYFKSGKKYLYSIISFCRCTASRNRCMDRNACCELTGSGL